jgi:macrodomain Ter protein organizer (MatP/YcbG family)
MSDIILQEFYMSLTVGTDKPKISVYLEEDVLLWFQKYAKKQKRSLSSQLCYMIEQLKSEEEEKGN